MLLSTPTHFLAPARLLEIYEAEVSTIPNEVLFNDPQYQKLIEKWVTAGFGIAYEKFVRSCEVGLNESAERVDADFFLRAEDNIYPFQITEVQEQGRRRGEEYRGFADGSIQSVAYTPEKGRLEGPTWIAKGIAKKVTKSYADSEILSLIVYANFSAYQLEYEAVRQAAEPYKDAFFSIWVITGYLCASLFSNDQLGVIPRWGIFQDPPAL